MNSSDAMGFVKQVKSARIPIIAIYASPSDYPGKWVARLWDTDSPTGSILISDNPDVIQSAIRLMLPQMSFIPRTPEDDPCIVGVYL